jgi:NhaP-type Na+/H+ or K+/H+ antiporter
MNFWQFVPYVLVGLLFGILGGMLRFKKPRRILLELGLTLVAVFATVIATSYLDMTGSQFFTAMVAFAVSAIVYWGFVARRHRNPNLESQDSGSR